MTVTAIVDKNSDGKYFWANLTDDNRVIAQSSPYTDKPQCVEDAKRSIEHVPDSRFLDKTDGS